ncbi:hypothetical protein Tco_1566867, partial [Tanacetum coccineum]
MGQITIGGQKGQFKGQSTHGQSYTSSNAPYWPIPCEEWHVRMTEAQGKGVFCTQSTLRSNTRLSHHGLPR